MSGGWSLYVIALVVLNVGASAWLLFWARSRRVDSGDGHDTMGHSFDGIEEYDMPLPRWWLWMFIGTIVFLVGYLVLYPGFGSMPGTLGWTAHGEHDADREAARAQHGPMLTALASKPIEDLARDPKAVGMGQRLFANTCAACHGADAKGGVGYPDLTDDDWLFGGEPATIEASILHGRMGMMPPFAPALGGDEGVREVVAYVQSLSGQQADAKMAEAGKARFQTICIACHGMDGKGNKALGAPNLTDDIWLFGGSAEAIEHGLRNGRQAQMPAHADVLGAEKAHLVAAYVFSLSHGEAAGQ